MDPSLIPLAQEAAQGVTDTGVTDAGTTGLYFELRVDGQPVDPLQWLKKR